MINSHFPGRMAVAFASLMAATTALPQETGKWTVDVSLYGLAASMSGEMTVKGIPADLDVGFSDILENLEMGGMGSLRIGYDRWALTTDVIYMGLGGSHNSVSADVDQWMIEPTLSYRISKGFEVLGGVRYNNLRAEIRGTGPLGNFRSSSGTQDWWDPIVGAHLSRPLVKKFSLNTRGDVGGFGVGSDFTWQAFPYVSWHITHRSSLQVGYRWVFNDYETGSGTSEFKYDILTEGPQIGFTLGF